MGNLKWFIEYSIATGDEPSMRSVHEAFELKGVDQWGLNSLDRSYLTALVDAGGGPMGIGSLAVSIGKMQRDDVLPALNTVDPGAHIRRNVRVARGKGIRTIAITASNVSPPAREAEISISVPIRADDGIPRLSVLLTVMGLMWEILAYHHEDQAKASLLAYGNHLKQLLNR